MAFAAYTPKARVQKPAPAFSGTAVVDGTFEGTVSHFRWPFATPCSLLLLGRNGLSRILADPSGQI